MTVTFLGTDWGNHKIFRVKTYIPFLGSKRESVLAIATLENIALKLRQ